MQHGKIPKIKEVMGNLHFARTVAVGIAAIIIAIAAPGQPVHAARIFVPELELFTEIGVVDDQGLRPVLQTAANVDISIEANNRVGARIVIGHEGLLDETIAIGSQQYNQLLTLKLVSITAGTPFESRAYVEFFSGEHDTIGTNDTFSRIFNTTDNFYFYQGYQYFSIDDQYTGLHQIIGTGLALGTEFGSDNLSFRWYGYRNPLLFDRIDTDDNPNTRFDLVPLDYDAFSTDLRLLYQSGRAAVDVYAGATYRSLRSQSPNRAYYLLSFRAGLMASFGFDELFELYAHFGIPDISFSETGEAGFPAGSSAPISGIPSGTPLAVEDLTAIGLSHFQFALEPRFNINDVFGMHISIINKPFFYNNDVYYDPGLDTNVKLFFGSYRPGATRFGVDIRNKLDSNLSYQGLDLVPFLSITGGGVIWDLSALIPVLLDDPNDLFTNLVVKLSGKTSF